METSTGIARDRLADMTRERDAWRASTFKCLFLFFAVNGSMIAAPHVERAWTEWRAEKPKVSVHVGECVPLTRGNPAVMQTLEWPPRGFIISSGRMP